jgi:hypothetical protein
VLRLKKGGDKMPHYKDGTPAKEGDVVKGKPYNTSHEVTGIIFNINPGEETCNCMVIFPTKVNLDEVAYGDFVKILNDRGGGKIAFGLYADYGEVKAFEKIL